ncbi:hypothetical protein NY2A_b466L [Paramecium bursaria Chlorella virus NY2A]|uniref:Uncharacterized protein b466L n=1 Tax=Paramecium bursaria Chlorella virus NY2A TaxID=46021 RepID=A7IWZ1_PBCVN|nr:hypothetical protein NY2A_b466L [Paramecium bursaria Chlorella virus NY2A]ABT14865.1 hypothetical protein NY2A_b466L [Paramecium bursaria Chlorella virus NY2A]
MVETFFLNVRPLTTIFVILFSDAKRAKSLAFSMGREAHASEAIFRIGTSQVCRRCRAFDGRHGPPAPSP